MKFFIRDDEGNEKEIESLNLNLKEGDTLLFKIPTEMSIDGKLRTKEILQQTFPDNKVILINNDIEVGVIRNG